MELHAAQELIYQAMEQHNLHAKGWSFHWDSAKLRFGLCMFGRKVIKMSRALVLANDEKEVRDTILHEIAHALVGPGHGHGRVWKLMAQAIGARPETCYSTANVKMVDSPYTFTCVDCGFVGHFHRKPKARRLVFARHSKCTHKANGGKLEWRMRGVPMSAALPKPMWQRQQAACAPAQVVAKQDLTQVDISAMWERLNKLEGK